MKLIKLFILIAMTVGIALPSHSQESFDDIPCVVKNNLFIVAAAATGTLISFAATRGRSLGKRYNSTWFNYCINNWRCHLHDTNCEC